MRYGWQLKRLPRVCECGSSFNVEHALSCKKGCFVSLRHNHLRNVTAKLLSECCKDVRIEPQLQPLTGETLASSNTSDEARLDISARGFWESYQMAFFRHKGPMAKRYVNQSMKKAYEINEKEKKRHYNDRIMRLETWDVYSLSVFGDWWPGTRVREILQSSCINHLRKKRLSV